jgi:hypothetical protein
MMPLPQGSNSNTMSVSESNISDAVVGHEAILWFLTHGGQEPVRIAPQKQSDTEWLVHVKGANGLAHLQVVKQDSHYDTQQVGDVNCTVCNPAKK